MQQKLKPVGKNKTQPIVCIGRVYKCIEAQIRKSSSQFTNIEQFVCQFAARHFLR